MNSRTRVLRLGTRGSELALRQARTVADAISRRPGAPAVEVVEIRTEGDLLTGIPLSKVDGKAFFTKEIEAALLEGAIDLAVHSLKDLATRLPGGLAIGAVLEREDPRDVLIGREPPRFEELPAGARIGTSSLRRRAFLARWRRDIELLELRGNVPTRLERLDRGDFDAIVLAAAGMKRLGLSSRISAFLPLDRVPPAVSQGAVAVQIRESDEETLRWIRPLDHPPTHLATRAERALLRTLEGGCQVPVGALATVRNETLRLSAAVCSLDGARWVGGTLDGNASAADALGVELAERLMAEGAAAILEEIRVRPEGAA